MVPAWAAIAILSSVLVAFLVHLCLKYGGRPRVDPDLIVRPGRCCWCMKEGEEEYFCGPCFRRMILRYAAVLAGTLCIPAGAAGGYVVGLAAGTPTGLLIFVGALAGVALYNMLAWTYVAVYLRERLHFYAGLLGFGVVFDPVGIDVSPRKELWRLGLLLRQARGRKRDRAPG